MREPTKQEILKMLELIAEYIPGGWQSEWKLKEIHQSISKFELPKAEK